MEDLLLVSLNKNQPIQGWTLDCGRGGSVECAQLMKLLGKQSETEWRNYLFELSRDLGFNYVMIAVGHSKNTLLKSCFARSNFPRRCWKNYLLNHLYHVDPTILHCFRSRAPIIWTPEIYSQSLGGTVFESGAPGGVTFPLHGCNGEIGLLSFCAEITMGAEFNAYLAERIAELSLLRDYAFQSSLRFFKEGKPLEKEPCLTERQVEILKWLAVGKSSWEISRIIDCSEATINFHISKIRKKYDVNTRQQAVMMAVSSGTILLNQNNPHLGTNR